MSAMSAHHLDLTERARGIGGAPASVTVDDRELVVCLNCGTPHPLADWCPRCDGTEEDEQADTNERRVG